MYLIKQFLDNTVLTCMHIHILHYFLNLEAMLRVVNVQ